MTKLHEWQAFARASGLRGWSRLKKDGGEEDWTTPE